MFVYLDNSATTRQYDQVTEVMKDAMENYFGNPSSLHSLGLASEKEVRRSRQISPALGAKEEEIIFNSGARKVTIRCCTDCPCTQGGKERK